MHDELASCFVTRVSCDVRGAGCAWLWRRCSLALSLSRKLLLVKILVAAFKKSGTEIVEIALQIRNFVSNLFLALPQHFAVAEQLQRNLIVACLPAWTGSMCSLQDGVYWLQQRYEDTYAQYTTHLETVQSSPQEPPQGSAFRCAELSRKKHRVVVGPSRSQQTHEIHCDYIEY